MGLISESPALPSWPEKQPSLLSFLHKLTPGVTCFLSLPPLQAGSRRVPGGCRPGRSNRCRADTAKALSLSTPEQPSPAWLSGAGFLALDGSSSPSMHSSQSKGFPTPADASGRMTGFTKFRMLTLKSWNYRAGRKWPRPSGPSVQCSCGDGPGLAEGPQRVCGVGPPPSPDPWPAGPLCSVSAPLGLGRVLPRTPAHLPHSSQEEATQASRIDRPFRLLSGT